VGCDFDGSSAFPAMRFILPLRGTGEGYDPLQRLGEVKLDASDFGFRNVKLLL
jgi:hypothetical protein